MKLIIAAALLLTPAAAALAAAESEPNATEASRESERRICRRIDGPASQTRVQRNRLCLTAAQWRSRRDPDLDEAMDILSTRTAPPPSTTYQGGMGSGPN